MNTKIQVNEEAVCHNYWLFVMYMEVCIRNVYVPRDQLQVIDEFTVLSLEVAFRQYF